MLGCDLIPLDKEIIVTEEGIEPRTDIWENDKINVLILKIFTDLDHCIIETCSLIYDLKYSRVYTTV